jgi:hypothetical protein
MRNTRNFGTYLFNGICSNGPEVGIVPHKLLLETSLKIKGMFRLFESTHIHVMLTTYIKTNVTYTTFRLVIAMSSLGIGPVSRLSLSRLQKKMIRNMQMLNKL